MRRVKRREDGCLLWLGYLTPDGYGRIGNTPGERPRQIGVHRVVYLDTIGPIPKGMEVDHACRTRACVEREHLVLISRSDHGKQGMATRWGENRTHCHLGHPYRRQRSGKAYCPTCQAISDAKRSRPTGSQAATLSSRAS